ncbi:MAG: hypothetical protein WB992_11175 [Bryobacteraceae bacterium]
MAGLFKVIGNSHGVTEQEVRRSLGHRRAGIDLAVILSFFLLYGWAASMLARWLCRLYGSGESFTTIVVMTAVASVMASTVGVMLGEEWSGIFEAFRIGNGHMSYRAMRIPWTQHRLGLFVAGIVLFLLIAVFHRRRVATGFHGRKY